MIKLHELHLKDLQNPIHPSLYEVYGDYQILILRLPELWEGKANILALRSNEFWKTKGRFFSYPFVIVGEEIYYYDRKAGELTKFENGFKELYLFLDEKIDAYMEDIEIAHDKIAFIEESLYKKQSFNPQIDLVPLGKIKVRIVSPTGNHTVAASSRPPLIPCVTS